MKEPTMEEVLELVRFRRDDDGKLYVRNVYGNVQISVHGSVGIVHGNVWTCVGGSVGTVHGNVEDVKGDVGAVGGDVTRNVTGKVYGKILNSL